MSSARWKEIKNLVDAALDRAPSERARFLDEACPDHLRGEVDSLLSHDAEDFLERPAVGAVGAVGGSSEELPAAERHEVDLVGRTLSHYEIRKKLGSGGMGEVFLAQDLHLDRRVALKVLGDDLEEEETAKKRFLREAKSAAALDHPYICKIYEIGEDSGRSFIAMEYIEGETLRERLGRSRLPADEALAIAAEIAEALDTAHREKIVHRDLKPANIMLTVAGHVKVLDFGLAKRVAPEAEADRGADSQFETASRLTGQGQTLGTLAYMSPEQLRGHAVDARSDVFAFGILLYEMISGIHPFSRSTSMDTAAAILNLDPPKLSEQRNDLPGGVESVVTRMLEKNPGDRYSSLAGVMAELKDVVEGKPLAHGVMGHRSAFVAAALIVLIATGILLWRSPWFQSSAARDGPPSVAVLPLTNIGDDPFESDYLASGISQAVATKLTQAGLQVTPWETARRYRDSNLSADAVARELNVDAVLVGTFHVAGGDLLTNLSLIDAESGFQSWADIIVEPYEDIFQMQLRIATGVATNLKQALTGEELEALAEAPSDNIDAYDLYLQGAHLMDEQEADATSVAAQYFRRAAELDPDLAEAHVGLGAVTLSRFYNGMDADRESMEQAETSFETALRLDPAAMRARRGLIFVHFLRGRSEACLIHGREAARLGSQYDVETLLAEASGFMFGGLPDRAIPNLRRVIDMDPANEAAHYLLTWATAWSLELEAAIDAGDEYLSRFGDFTEVHTALGLAHHAHGSLDRAREHYARVVALARRDGSSPGPIFTFSGALFEQRGERGRAEEAWREGVLGIEERLQTEPDNNAYRAVLASLYGRLGEATAFSVERRRALGSDFNAYELYGLAATHAALRETDEAKEVLRHTLDAGRVGPMFRLFFTAAAPGSLESEALAPFVRAYEAEERRLRELY